VQTANKGTECAGTQVEPIVPTVLGTHNLLNSSTSKASQHDTYKLLAQQLLVSTHPPPVC
jgi:hypothetical protein